MLLLDRLSAKDDTSELMAVVRTRHDGADTLPVRDDAFLAVVDGPNYPGNLGADVGLSKLAEPDMRSYGHYV